MYRKLQNISSRTIEKFEPAQIEDQRPNISHSQGQEIFPTGKFLEGQGEWYQPTIGFHWHQYWLRDAGSWEGPEMYQMDSEPGTQKNWPKETWKKCPLKVIQTSTKARSCLLNLPMCLSTSTVLFFLPNKHLTFFTTFTSVEILFCKAEGQGLVTDWSRT